MITISDKPKKKVTAFVLAIKQLVDTTDTNEEQNSILYKSISDAFEYIYYYEWGIALENLLDNLYEVEFPLNEETITLAKKAIFACKMDYRKWRFIEELRK